MTKTKELKDLSEYYPVRIAGDEQFLFRHDVIDGGIFKRDRSVLVHFVSNYRVGTMDTNQNISQMGLEHISDVLVMDSRRESAGNYSGFSSGTRGARYHAGGYRSRSIEYGNVVITSAETSEQTWYNVRSPDEVVKLIKSLRKTRLEQLER